MIQTLKQVVRPRVVLGPLGDDNPYGDSARHVKSRKEL